MVLFVCLFFLLNVELLRVSKQNIVTHTVYHLRLASYRGDRMGIAHGCTV